nr:hypothetical protein [Desulfobacteraceae bacterium]
AVTGRPISIVIGLQPEHQSSSQASLSALLPTLIAGSGHPATAYKTGMIDLRGLLPCDRLQIGAFGAGRQNPFPKGGGMDISRAIAAMKQKPGFTEKVGMVLVHNGVVRA